MTAAAAELALAQGPGDHPQSPNGQQAHLISPDLVMLSRPSGARAEGLRQLRTRLIAQHLDCGRRTLALTSPTSDSGCSFIAANLAVGFALIGARVLLIDGDMRTEGINRYFGPSEGSRGLLQYLSSSEDGLERIVEAGAVPSLSLIRAGGRAANAQELLSGDRFERLVHDCLRQYDLTIIDTPPSKPFADAQRISAIARYNVIVARAHKSYAADVSELCRNLAADRVTVVGTILNEF